MLRQLLLMLLDAVTAALAAVAEQPGGVLDKMGYRFPDQ